MKYNAFIILALLTILISCEKDIAGHKTLNINFSNAKNGAAIDSIFCFIGQPSWIYYHIITETFSDQNGNCKLEADYKHSDHYGFVVREDLEFNGNKAFTYRGYNHADKYRVKGSKPYVDFGDQNEFNLNLQLIPLTKFVIIFEFGKNYNGFTKFEYFEKNESIYSISRGGKVPNSLWLSTDKDSIDTYVSSIDKSTLVYSFLSNDGKTLFSKSMIIDPNSTTARRIQLKYD
jgi:hypothetical protein